MASDWFPHQVRFSTATLELPALRRHAPSQCASLATLVFTSSLSLGHVREAFEIISKLDAHAATERADHRFDAASTFVERKKACLRSLVSTLHSRGALHLLASLIPAAAAAAAPNADEMADVPAAPTPTPTTAPLAEELHAALLEHARGAAVLPDVLAGRPTVFAVAYALRVRSGQYVAAGRAQFELATRLEAEWRSRVLEARPCAEVLPLLEALVDAYGASIASLELTEVPTQRWVLERVPNRAARLRAALDAYQHQLEHRLDDRPGSAMRPSGTHPDPKMRSGRKWAPSKTVAYDAGFDEHSATGFAADADTIFMQLPAGGEEESVESVRARLEHEYAELRKAETLEPDRYSKWRPRQLYTLRQRRLLASGRACLLRKLAQAAPSSQAAARRWEASASFSLPEPLSNAGMTIEEQTRGSTVDEAAAVLRELLTSAHFEQASTL